MIETIGNGIEQKASVFMLMKDYPGLLAVFCISIILIIIAVLAIVIAKTNPGFFNKMLDMRNEKITLENGEIIDERRKEKRREEDKYHAPCLTSECTKYNDLKTSINQLNKNVTESINEQKIMKGHLDEVWTSTLKSDFVNEGLHISERLYKGLKYVWWIKLKEETNGDTEDKVTAMSYKHPDVYKTITYREPQLKLEQVEKKYKIGSIK